MTKASDNAFPSILITEGTEPSAPAAGKQRLYIDSTTHKLKRTDSSGTDVTIEAAGSVAADAIFDAKGDLAVGTGADTASKLTVGANGTILIADSAQSTGLKYVFPPRMKISAGSDVSSVSFADTDLLFPVLASTSYVFEFHLYCFTNASSVGIRLAVNGPAGATGRWGAYVPTSASSATSTTVGIGQNATLDTVIVGTTTGPGASGVYAIVTGSMTIAGTAGNLVLRHASETATQTVIEAGSWGVLYTL